MNTEELLKKYSEQFRYSIEELRTIPLEELFSGSKSEPGYSIIDYFPCDTFTDKFLPENYSLYSDEAGFHLEKKLIHTPRISSTGVKVERLERLVVKLPEISENDTLPKIFDYITQAYDEIERYPIDKKDEGDAVLNNITFF